MQYRWEGGLARCSVTGDITKDYEHYLMTDNQQGLSWLDLLEACSALIYSSGQCALM